ncbi:O-antigen polymerase [Leptothoe sp. LEGE 181152]|nr:O-antigen polymerase [Leptothoe sp. LEGE 181152]
MASAAATSVGIGFLASVFFDSRKGLRNLFRTDLLCLLAIYALTLAEFLFPQEGFLEKATSEQTALALNIVLVGMAALSIGRHLVEPKPVSSPWLALDEVSNKTLFQIFLFVALVGYLHKLMSVQFNLFEMVNAMMGARFSQPWTRARLGGLSSLLIELSLMAYVVPPLAAVVWNRRRSFSGVQIFTVIVIFAFTLFQGFASGTRNIFITYVATFMMAYILTLQKNTFRNTVIPILLAGFICTYGSYHMLEFRNIGLRNYVENRVYASEETRNTFAVDYNLASIGWVAEAMPQTYPFLGPEVLVWSLVRPIPRALWPGKPEGLTVSIEEIAGADGWTVAATYLGESYMMAGMFGVVAMSLFFGALAAWWNRMAMRQQSDYALVVYALGFFAAGITMRSMFWLTTTILPVLALIALRKFGPLK